MENKTSALQNNIKEMTRVELEKAYMEANTKVVILEQQLAWYQEQIKKQQKALFGKSSEKAEMDQISLFDEAEVESTPISVEPTLEEITYTRKKKSKKTTDLSHLPVTTIEYTLSAEELSCPTCKNQLHSMSKQIRKELVFIPAKVEVVEHVQHIYSCRKCEENEISVTIIKAKAPKAVIAQSVASASLIANIINDKYDKAIPLYRQEVSYQRQGIAITRQNMSNWIIKVANSYFKVIIEAMTQQLMKMSYISADETTVQVLHEPGKTASSQSYMWVYKSGRSEAKQVVLFQYEASRAHSHAISYLEQYRGILLSDGYQAYDKIEGIVQAGCWAHCRRYFNDALEATPKGINNKETHAYQCYSLINQLFKIEKDNQDKSYKELTEIRQKESKVIVDEFFETVKELRKLSLPKSLFGKAIDYAVNQENKLRTYLEDGRIEISNNVTERAIRPFTIGRKNWLFANTVKGAQSSAILYSLIETAKANQLIPYKYIETLLTNLPNMDISNQEELEKVMPWSTSLPENLRMSKKY